MGSGVGKGGITKGVGVEGMVMGVESGLGVAEGCGVIDGIDAKAVATLSSAILFMAVSEVAQPKSPKSAPNTRTVVKNRLNGLSRKKRLRRQACGFRELVPLIERHIPPLT